jgi:hypothetical protein
MKSKILEALKTKHTGVGDTVLNRIADKLARTVTTEDGVATAVDAVTLQSIIESEADRRATEATQSAVGNYEKKHGLKDGQKVQTTTVETQTTQTDKTGEGGLTAEALKAAIAAAMKPFEEKINALETGKLTDARRLKLDEVTKELPESFKKPYARISLKELSDAEFDTLISETASEVKELAAEVAAKGATFGTPLGGGVGKKEPSKEETEAVMNGLL